MPAPHQRPTRPVEPAADTRPQVDDFARSVHASYLSRWLRHNPSALDEALRQEVAETRRGKRTSAA